MLIFCYLSFLCFAVSFVCTLYHFISYDIVNKDKYIHTLSNDTEVEPIVSCSSEEEVCERKPSLEGSSSFCWFIQETAYSTPFGR